MARVNVFDECGELEGWFDEAKAEEFKEATRWDGSNHISIATGSQWDHQALYRTAGGRWVLHSWSQWQGRPETYRFVSDDKAREWLLKNEHDEAVEKYFGEIEEERGPGRPEIGPVIQVRLPEDLLTKVDAAAEKAGLSRAETIRQLLEGALEGQVYQMDEDWDTFEPVLRAELDSLGASKEECDKVVSRTRELATKVWDVAQYAAEELELLRDVARYAAKELKLLRE